MLKMLYACFDTELTFLQKQQVLLGKKNGLSNTQIQMYASREFNYLQMEQIRLAFQQGVSEKVIHKMCHAHLSIDTLHALRTNEKQTIHNTRKYVIWFALLFVSIVWMIPKEQPYFSLTQEEVTIHVGDPFDPMQYIDTYSYTKGRIEIPQMISTDTSGHYICVYRFISQNVKIEKVLHVYVLE